RRPSQRPGQHQDAQMLPVPGRATQSPSRAQPTTRIASQSGQQTSHQSPRQRADRPARSPRKRWSFGKVTLSLLLVFLLLVGGLWFYLDSSLNRIDALPEGGDRPAPAEGTNWLIVGSDSREGL